MLKSSNNLIGVFDSGLGGLSVLKKFLSDVPGYHYIYLGDNARVPYGNKSPETIYNYTVEAVEFLLYVQLFQQPITRISSFIMQYNQAMAGFERFLGVMDIDSQKDVRDALNLSQVKGKIEFRDVSFQYGDRFRNGVA